MIKEIYSELANFKKHTKKGFFKPKIVEVSIYEERYKYSKEELNTIEQELNIKFPNEIYEWLLLAGCGAIFDELLIGEKEYIFKLEDLGALSGYISFATDDLGNHYAFNPNNDESIFYACHDPLGYAKIAESFSSFLAQLKQADFNIETVTSKLQLIDM